MITPIVSIIIPCYNHAHFLPDALQSILSQTFTSWQAIVVNDGSSDDTPDVVAQFTDSRILYVHQDNGGLPAARNTGIQHAEGRYLAFLDADDRWDPEFLCVMANALERNAMAAFVYCGVRFMDAHGNELPRKVVAGPPPADELSALTEIRSFLPHSVLCRRADIISVGLFDETLTSCEDWDLWIRLIRLRGAPVSVQGCLAWYRLSECSMSRNTERMLMNMRRVIDKYLEPHSSLRYRAYASAHFVTAIDYLMYGNRQAVITHLRRAIVLDSSLLKTSSFYYELLCGDQPKGHRGIIAELDIEQKVEAALLILSDVLCENSATYSRVECRMATELLLYTAADMSWRQNNYHLVRAFLKLVIRNNAVAVTRSKTWRLLIKAVVGPWFALGNSGKLPRWKLS